VPVRSRCDWSQRAACHGAVNEPQSITYRGVQRKATGLKRARRGWWWKPSSMNRRGNPTPAELDVGRSFFCRCRPLIPTISCPTITQAGLEPGHVQPQRVSLNEAWRQCGPAHFPRFPLARLLRRPPVFPSCLRNAWEILPSALTPMVYTLRNHLGPEAAGRFWFKLFPKNSPRARFLA